MSLPTGPLRVTAAQYREMAEWFEDKPDWSDAIEAEEQELDEPRCPNCGHPSTGLCYDCEPSHDSHLEAQYDEANGDIDI